VEWRRSSRLFHTPLHKVHGQPRGTVEKRRLIEHPDQCDRQIDLSQMIQNPSAIVQRAVEF
jgi:hypothetical protein